MTETEFYEQKNRIDALFTDIVDALRMDEWTLKARYVNDTCDSDEDGDRTLAQVNASWAYREACINIFVPDMAQCSDAEIQSHLIHELMHVAVNEMREWQDADDGNSHSLRRAKNHEERVVCSLVRMLRAAVLNAQEGRWTLGRIDKVAANDSRGQGNGGGEGGSGSVEGENGQPCGADSSASRARTNEGMSKPGHRKGRW